MNSEVMGNNRPTIVALAVVAVLSTGAAAADAGQNRAEEVALQHFVPAVDAYVTLHRDVERHVPPLEISPEARTISEAVEAMATAMRAARPAARAGDLFDDAAASLLRNRIRETLRERHHDPADILASIRDEGKGPTGPARAAVNERVVWAQGSSMPSCLLEVLPPLPAELEYRFVERDLALIDIHAALFVDVLPGALP